MGDVYSLTLYNESSQPGFTFAVYAVVSVMSGQKRLSPGWFDRRSEPPGTHTVERMTPSQGSPDVYPLVWLAKPLEQGSRFTFTWTLDFSLVHGPRGCREGAPWSASKAVPVTYEDTAQNCALLDYPNNAYTLALDGHAHPVKGRNVYIDTTGAVPSWTKDNGPSVGLAIAVGDEHTPTPAIVTDSGPNLTHIFDLRPSYYIWAGQEAQGTVVDPDTVAKHQQVTYAPGVFTSEWTLDAANLWVKGPPSA